MGNDVSVRFEPEDLVVIDRLVAEKEWSRAKVVRWAFRKAVAAGLLDDGAHQDAPMQSAPVPLARPRHR